MRKSKYNFEPPRRALHQFERIAAALDANVLNVSWQGHADAGLCYPTQTLRVIGPDGKGRRVGRIIGEFSRTNSSFG